jgi:hypothetical protein
MVYFFNTILRRQPVVGERVEPERRVRGATVHKAGSKIPT